MATAKPDAAPEVAPQAMTLHAAKPGHPKPPLSTRQQRFWLTHLLVLVVVGAVVAVAIFKPDSSIQTAIFTVLGTGFLGPLKDAFRTFFPGGPQDDPAHPPA